MEPIEEKIQTLVERPRKKSRLIKIIAGIIILIAVGVGVSLYTRAWDPIWNPFRPSPEEVINSMAAKMGNLKTVHSKAKIDITAKEDIKEVFRLSMDFDSDSDSTDSQNPKSAGNFYMNLAFEGMEFSLAGQGKTIGEDSYLKLTTIPALPMLEPFFQMIGFDIASFKNQWIKINSGELIKELMEIFGVFITPEMEGEMQKQKEQQAEMIQKVQALLKDKKLYIVKREFPDKEIRGVKTYHYLVALNEEEIKKIIPELYKILIETIKFGPSPTEEEWQEFQKELSSKIDEFFAKIGDITAELWIGKKDSLLYKIKGEKEIDLSKFAKSAKGKVIVKFDIDFSNFNQPVKIEAPGEYKTLEEIFETFLPSLQPSPFPPFYISPI